MNPESPTMATGGSPVWQCQACQRQFGLVAEGMGELRLLERPRLVVPETMLNGEPFFCGEPDCAAAAQAFSARVAAQQKAELTSYQRNLKSKRQQRRDGKRVCQSAIRNPQSAMAVAVARMPYKDDDQTEIANIQSGDGSRGRSPHHPPPAPIGQNVGRAIEGTLARDGSPLELTHRKRQADWVATGKGDNDNERMLELLFEGFNPRDPQRAARGRWISKQDFILTHGILTPNSRASELRGSDTHVPHPLVTQWRLEIDQSSDQRVTGQEGSCYSVCFVEHSERLRRERENCEKGQETF